MRKRGFTLIETLIYIALFAILMSGAVVAAYNLLEGGGRNESNIEVQEEGTFLTRKINWALTGGSTVYTDGTTLTLMRLDLGYQIVISWSGTTMSIKRGVQPPVPLNSDRYKVTGPASGQVFTVQPASGGLPPSVTVSFRIDGRPFIFRTYMRQ